MDIKETTEPKDRGNDMEFIEASLDGIEYAYHLLDERFVGPQSTNPQIFHDAAHSHNVERRSVLIAEETKEVDPEFINNRKKYRTRLIASWHDVVQDFKSENPGTLQERRIRARGDNERASGEELKEYMRTINSQKGREVFTQDDEVIVDASMAGTIPTWDDKLDTILQKNITGQSPIEAVIVGLADIGGAGIDGPEQYIHEGNAEFQEVRIGITRRVREIVKNNLEWESLTLQEKDYISSEIRKWLKVQVDFVKGRQQLLDEELGNIGDKTVEDKLRSEVFTKFKDSIEVAEERASDLDKKDFNQLLRLLGYI